MKVDERLQKPFYVNTKVRHTWNRFHWRKATFMNKDKTFMFLILNNIEH